MAALNVSWATCQTITETFKVVDNHPIQVDIVLPPGLKEGKHPLIIAYHGGFLIAGARNHYFFMAAWLPAYAASTSAIIVSPDHRLLPSATVPEILSDLEDLWIWVHKSLPLVLASHEPQHSVDLDHILLEGNSAGGFNAAHLALSHSADVRAAILVYPMVDCLMDYLANGPPEGDTTAAGSNTSDGLWKGDVLDSKIELACKSGWVTQRVSPEGLLLTQSIVKGGKFGQIFGSEKRSNPLHRLRDQIDTDGLPAKIWILQGKDDTGVPAEGSIAFTNAVKSSSWPTQIILDIVDSEPSEHGFDSTWTMTDKKLTDRLDWINQSWL